MPFRMKTHLRSDNFSRLAFVFCCWFLTVCAAGAAQRTWDGGGIGWDWRTAQNWDGSFLQIPIAPGDTLVFPAGPTKLANTNDFLAGTNFNSLTYSGSGYASAGNMIGLSNGVSVTHASGSTALSLPVTLRDNQTFSVSSPNSSLYLIGNVNIGLNTLTLEGDGNFALLGGISNSRFVTLRNSVRKAGAGVLTVLQPSDHNVPTIVNGGTLAAESRMTNSDVTINTGASLRGSGSIGGLTVNSGGVVQPGGINPGALHRASRKTVAVLDLAIDAVRFYDISTGQQVSLLQ